MPRAPAGSTAKAREDPRDDEAMRATASGAAGLRATARRFLSGAAASSSHPPKRSAARPLAHGFRGAKKPKKPHDPTKVRAGLNVEVRPETYRAELDVKIADARACFDASPERDDGAGGGKPIEAAKIAVPLPDEIEVFESPKKHHFRMRAEFRVWHAGDKSFMAMFDNEDPKTPVEIETFPMGSERINSLMKEVLREIKDEPALRRKLFQVNFLTTSGTDDALVSMLYHRPLDAAWEAAAEEARQRMKVSVIGRSRKQKIVLGNPFVMETLTVDGEKFTYKQLEGGFTQPNSGTCEKMLEWARDVSVDDARAPGSGSGPAGARPRRRDDDFLELYCGNGNFTVALAPLYRNVLATEMSKVSVAAAVENFETNGTTNAKVVRLSAEELVLVLDSGKKYERMTNAGLDDLSAYDLRTLLVDPPRAGMGEEVSKFASRFDRIIYISCNPKTLAEDCRILAETHEIKRFAVFDQFPYTPHLESGALLVKRK